MGRRMTRVANDTAVGLSALLVLLALSAWPPAVEAAAAQSPGLQIVVLQGEDGENVIERGAEVPTLVEVRDANDQPLPGVSVRFLLGEGGRATLNAGLQEVTLTTNALGQAAVMVNPVAVGAVELSVTVAFAGGTATATIVQTNFATDADAAAGVSPTGVAQTGAAAGAPAGGGPIGAPASGGGLGTGAIAGLAGAGAAVGVALAVAGGGDSTPPVMPEPRREPSMPSPPMLTAGDRQLTVSWTAPADNGAPILDYDVQHRPSGGAWTQIVGRATTSLSITGLTNGTEYEVQVRARNSVGPGPWSFSSRDTPMAAPSRPAAPTLTPGDGRLEASWSAPADNGAPIIDYDVRHRPSGGAWTEMVGRATTSVSITGLTNGTVHEVQVRARNSVGPGPWSPPARGTPISVPSRPAAPGLTQGDRLLTASWRAPAANGAPIIDYDVRHRPSGGTWTEIVGHRTTSVPITGLTNGTEYEVQVRARNSVGHGPWSESSRGTPTSSASVPSRPAPPELTPGNRRLTASWRAPADNGAPIIDYDVRHRASGGTWTVIAGRTTTSVSITGLTNGTEYEVQVRARNSVGPGRWSESSRGTPASSATVPSRPAAPELTLGDRRLTASWRAPADNGAPIIDYDVRHRPSRGTWTEIAGRRTTSVSITGLTNGTEYEVQVRARNSVGPGPWSPTARGTPMSSASVPSRPAAPTLTPGDGELGVSWTAPADNGAPIEYYELQGRVEGSGAWEYLTQDGDRQFTVTSLTVVGLTNGTTYEFRVRAINAVGPSDWSRSASGTPVGSASVPSRPAAPTVTPGDGELGVSWRAPADNGAPIEHYELQGRIEGSGSWSDVTASGDTKITATSVTIGDLSNGTTYEFRVRAVNAVGPSDWSRSASGTPAGSASVPSRPAAPTLTPGDGRLTVSWNAPADNGAPIEHYELRVRPEGSGTWAHPTLPGDEKITATSVILSGLTNGTTYEVQIRAINSVGPSDWSLSGRGTPAASTTERAVFGRLSVADADAQENVDDTIDFTVTLDGPAGAAVSVDYATVDGSAKAGADYTAKNGTLTFLPGERSKTIRVDILDDTHDEGAETFTLVLSNASGGLIVDGRATGRIENHDPLPRALVARFGRTAAVHVVEQVEERLQAPRKPGFEGRFAGQELRPGMERGMALNALGRRAGPMGAAWGSAAQAGLPAPGVGQALSGGPGDGLLDGRGLFDMGGGDMLNGSAFALNREAGRGGVVSFWTRGAQSAFSGREGALTLGGGVRTTMFGADYAKGPLVVGLSLSNSRGLGNYAGVDAGRVASSVTGLYPWLGYKATDRVTVWGVTGYGAGGLMLTPDGGPVLESGLSMAMAAGGTRGELVAARSGGFGLAFKADALWVGTRVERVNGSAGHLAGTEATVTRFRTGLEGSREFLLAGRVSLRPSAEVGLRHDGGDAETGAGMDVGGGLILSDSSTGLAVDMRVRMLVAHQAEGFRERSMALSFRYDPTPSTPLGFAARVAPSWGGQAAGGADALWGRQTMAGLADGGFASGNRLDTEIGYGLPVGSRFVGTPRVGFAASEYGRDYRVGYGLTLLERESLNLQLGVDAHRRQSPMQVGADNGFLGRAVLGW